MGDCTKDRLALEQAVFEYLTLNLADVKEVMKPERFRNISVTYKTTDKKTKPKRKRFFGPEMLYLYLTGTYMIGP